MKRLFALLLFLVLTGGVALGQTPTLVPPFPNSPTANQEVIGPDGQIYVWDGTKWAHGIGTPPGPWAPEINIAGGINNYAPLASPTFTGTVNLANLIGTTTGTWTFPDGSTYTSAGHNNMKALGIGAPAPDPAAFGQLAEFNLNGNQTTSVILRNTGTGAFAAASYYAVNDVLGPLGPHYAALQLTNTGFTAGGTWVGPDEMLVGTDADNGIAINSASAIGSIAFYEDTGILKGWISVHGWNFIVPLAVGSDLDTLSVQPALGSIQSTGFNQLVSLTNDNWNLSAGAYYDATANWRALTPSAQLINELADSIGFYVMTGLTANATFAPLRNAYFSTDGLYLAQAQTGGVYNLNLNGGVNISAQPWNGADNINSSATGLLIPNGTSANVTVHSGLIIVTETAFLGNSCMWLAGGGAIHLVGDSRNFCSADTTCGLPAPGEFAMCFFSNGYWLVNNTGNQTTFGVTVISNRNAS